jgi:NADH-quinone oxidoreductase subunit F
MSMERPLTRNIKRGVEPSLADYERSGGYGALRKALKGSTPTAVTQVVKDSNLRGRGGAGFSTGTKWSFVPMGKDAPQPKYFVLNADEMEPGTFKDRLLLEGNPHLVIEGIILASYAIEASTAYVFIRGEYILAAERMSRAVTEAEQRGYLGRDILGSGFHLEVHIHSSAGRYICGEETALLTALEGQRPIPRTKPPYPQTAGLWGRPAVVNNVETAACVPGIVEHGADWFKALGRGEDSGTKIFGVSGKVNRPGAWELPMGTTIREILEEHAGGMREGVQFRALLPGGASTGFLTEEHLDLAMDFRPVEAAGSRLGTGTMIILDDQTCPVGMLRNLEQFFARESCGWCTPCRDGLPWTERILQAIENGDGQAEDLAVLAMHVQELGPGKTFCAHAPGAMMPLETGLKHFRAEFDRHLSERRCPWR